MATHLAADLLAAPVWHALKGRQSRFAVSTGDVSRYAPAIAPFAAMAAGDLSCLRQLSNLLEPGETIYLAGEEAFHVADLTAQGISLPDLAFTQPITGLQMVAPERESPLADAHPEIPLLRLSCADASAMMDLTTIAFPGFFRPGTCEMGTYYGVRDGGELVAMAGERMAFDRYREISGVCTHPAYTGRGYAAMLIARLLEDHRRDGLVSFLHLAASNQRAFALYRRLGFSTSRQVLFLPVTRR